MITIKEKRAISRATPETQKLCFALQGQGVKALIEFWDGYKHIDIAIPEAKLNIEVDGVQHNISPRQALADLKRTYYSFKKGYFTLRIPNSLIGEHFKECVDLVMEIVKENKILSRKSYGQF
jgi:very-short-patch-repair endonuclease